MDVNCEDPRIITLLGTMWYVPSQVLLSAAAASYNHLKLRFLE